MVDAPEKIWATAPKSNCIVSFNTPSLDYNIEYTRSDLVAELAAENERLKRARMAQIDYGCDLQRIIEDLCRGGPIREPRTSARHHYNMAKEYKASAIARAGAVKVKNLEWQHRIGVDGTFDAYTDIGHYIATITDDGRGMWYLVGLTQSNYCMPDLNVAKAAAQADYERRILSCLTTEPAAPEGRQEPIGYIDPADIGRKSSVGELLIHWCCPEMRGRYTQPLYTRPSEQAVTNEMVEQMCRTPAIEDFTPTNDEWARCQTVQDQYDLMKRRIRKGMAARKAAMEARR